MIENNKIIIYLNRLTKKLDKYIKNKKLEVKALKNITSNKIFKNTKNY